MPSLTAPIADVLHQKEHHQAEKLRLINSRYHDELKQLGVEIVEAEKSLGNMISSSKKSLTGLINIITENFFGRDCPQELHCQICGRDERLCLQSTILDSRGHIRPEADIYEVRGSIICSRCIRHQKGALVDLNVYLLELVKRWIAHRALYLLDESREALSLKLYLDSLKQRRGFLQKQITRHKT